MLNPLKLGFHLTTCVREQKIIFMVNFVSIMYICSLLTHITVFSLIDSNLILPQALMGYSFLFLAILIVLLLNYLGKFTSAKSILIIVSLVNTYLFDNFILPNYNLEIYYIISVIFSLFLYKRQWFPNLLFISSLLLFFNFFEIHTHKEFDIKTIHYIIYFTIIYAIGYLTMKANEKSTLKLERINQELKELKEFQNQFFHNLAHEIKTPLTILTGNAEMLENKTNTPDKKRTKEIKVIQKQHQKIQRILDDVLDLSSMEKVSFTMKKASLNIQELLSRIIFSFEHMYTRKDIKINFNIHTKENLIIGSGIYLEKAIGNILSNAFKFSPEGSVVTISLNQTEEYLEIRIKDQGIGVKNEDQLKVFNSFYKSENHISLSSGTGIGLAFTQKVISHHNGSICLTNNKDSGVTVAFKIPIHYALESPIASHHKPVTKNLSLKNILVVDHSKEMRKYLSEILPNHNILEAKNETEAVDKLQHNQIHLVLSSFTMPEINDITLIEKIKTESPRIPIIALSGTKDHDTRLQFLTLGVDDYLTKPFHPEELLIRIENCLKKTCSKST